MDLKQVYDRVEQDCQKTLVFLKILEGIDQRISSYKHTSKSNSDLKPIRASIDKLNLRVCDPVPRDVFLKKALEKGYTSELFWGNGRACFHQIKKDDFSCLIPDCSSIHTIISNPSKAACWQSYLDCLNPLRSILGSLKLSRLDLALDFENTFDELKKWLIVEGVSTIHDFHVEQSRGQKNTGIRYGKKPRQVELYDYALKHGLPGPIARLEERFFAKRVSRLTLEDLPNFVRCEDQIFKKIKFVHAQVPECVSGIGPKPKELSQFLHKLGYAETKRQFNAHGNFDRDYKKFIIEELKCASVAELFSTFWNGKNRILRLLPEPDG